MGYFIYRVAERRSSEKKWPKLALYLFAANAPDMDFLPGLIVGEPGKFHHGVSHSFGAAILFGLTVWLAITFYKRKNNWFGPLLGTILYSSHAVLDYLGADNGPPYGIPIFWPFTNAYYASPIPIFLDIQRPMPSGTDFVLGLMSVHNLAAAIVEFLLLCPLIWATSISSREKLLKVLCAVGFTKVKIRPTKHDFV